MNNKILVPLNDTANIVKYVDAGADEFYMGFYDDNFTDKHGKFAEINRMSGFREYANKYTFKEILNVIRKVKERGKSIYITMNAAVYSGDAIKDIVFYFKQLAHAGADGVIISIPELVKPVLENGLVPVASTMCGIYNTDIVKAFHRLGVKRMILPRDLSISEIAEIVREEPKMQYEVFLMRNGCRFSDSHCLGAHRPQFGSMCYMLNSANSNIVSFDDSFQFEHDMELNQFLYKHFFHIHASCGLCALYKFAKLGITAYKIVGRADDSDGVLEDIKLVKHNIEIALNSKDEDDYLSKMKKIPNSYDGCKLGLGCYYPEVRF